MISGFCVKNLMRKEPAAQNEHFLSEMNKLCLYANGISKSSEHLVMTSAHVNQVSWCSGEHTRPHCVQPKCIKQILCSGKPPTAAQQRK